MKNKKFLLLVITLCFAVALIFTNTQITEISERNFYNSLSMGVYMVLLWISEIIPIYVTALIPWVVGVPLGIIDAQGLSASYGDKMIYLFFGGFILAMTLEKWQIHIIVANSIINLVGHSKPRILFGFIMVTGMISMWVSNTATALMMLPMAVAIIELLPENERKNRFAVFMILAVAYGANIGGMATLVGSPPNLQMANLLSKQYNTEVDFLDWFVIGFPVAMLMLLLAFGFFWLFLSSERKGVVPNFVAKRERFNRDQWIVVSVFSLVVFGWIFKDLIAGPTGMFTNLKLTDEGIAIFGAIVLLVFPSSVKKGQTLLTWSDTKELPWGILLMFGGGLALASCLDYGGVIDSIALVFKDLGNSTYLTLLIVMVVVAVFGTELLSNLALVTLFVPIIAKFCLQNDLPLVDLCIPLTLAASCGFMMPVGTPPNAIAYSSGLLNMRQMLSFGFMINIIGMIAIIGLSVLIFGK